MSRKREKWRTHLPPTKGAMLSSSRNEKGYSRALSSDVERERILSLARKQENLAAHYAARKKTESLAARNTNCKASAETDALTFQGNAVQCLQVEFYNAVVLLVGARRVGRDLGRGIAGFDEVVLDEITFDFFAADVGEHVAVDLDTR